MIKQPTEEQTEIGTLLRLSGLINSSLDIQTVMDNAMRSVEELLDAEASSIFEVDRVRGELFFRLARGKEADKVREIRLKIGEGVAGWVAQTGTPLTVSDPQHDTRFCQRADDKSGFHTRSILCVPLKTREKLIGVLQVLNKRSPEGFNDRDLEMLTIFGNQIATALENAHLYTRLNEKFAMTAEELKVTQEKLIRSERLAALGRLSQGVAHEVRNPVMIIGGFTRRLQCHFPPDDPAQDKLKIILSETERLQQMVKDIEGYTSLPRAVFRSVDLVDLAERVLSESLDSCETREIRVEKNFSEAIPEIPGDVELLELAVKNILSNAIEAMPKGGTLEVALTVEADWIILCVKDTGVGIDPQSLPNVFDPFFTSKTRGTGLGLTTVHRIICEHNGEIKIDSTPGTGTTVRIWLPRKQ